MKNVKYVIIALLLCAVFAISPVSAGNNKPIIQASNPSIFTVDINAPSSNAWTFSTIGVNTLSSTGIWVNVTSNNPWKLTARDDALVLGGATKNAPGHLQFVQGTTWKTPAVAMVNALKVGVNNTYVALPESNTAQEIYSKNTGEQFTQQVGFQQTVTYSDIPATYPSSYYAIEVELVAAQV